MTNKSKSPADRSHANPQDSGKDQYKRHVDGHITIGGQIEVHPPPDSVKAESTEREDEHTYRKKNYTVSWLTLIAVSIYAGLAFWQGCEAHRQAESAQASNRPYVGFSGMGLSYIDKDRRPDGTLIQSQFPTKTSVSLAIQGKIKNYGPLPGLNFRGDWKVIVGGVEQKGSKIPDTASTIYPTQEIILPGTIGTNDYGPIMRGEKALIVQVNVAYDGPAGHYGECKKQQFAPDVNGFFDLGNCSQ